MNTYQRIQANRSYPTPDGWIRIKTIDMHTGGEPLRVILEGFPSIQGHNILECRRFVRENYDHLRKVLMHEPRGHADMYGCILLPPNDDEADFGILFLHNEGYSTMCGHAVIAITKLAVEMGWVDRSYPETKVVIDAPCGRIEAFAKMKDQEVESVYFHGVPSFVLGLDLSIEVPQLGTVTYDLAYGGAFYAYVNSDTLGLDLTPSNYPRLIETGMAIKRAIMASNQKIEHPFEADLSFLYGTIFIGGPITEGIDSRNVCIFAEGEVDRCPTGSGVSGRMPIHFRRKEIHFGESLKIESITGSVFTGAVVEQLTYGPHEAIIPRVEGNAFVTGQHEFFIDPKDPFQNGFFLR